MRDDLFLECVIYCTQLHADFLTMRDQTKKCVFSHFIFITIIKNILQMEFGFGLQDFVHNGFGPSLASRSMGDGWEHFTMGRMLVFQ